MENKAQFSCVCAICTSYFPFVLTLTFQQQNILYPCSLSFRFTSIPNVIQKLLTTFPLNFPHFSTTYNMSTLDSIVTFHYHHSHYQLEIHAIEYVKFIATNTIHKSNPCSLSRIITEVRFTDSKTHSLFEFIPFSQLSLVQSGFNPQRFKVQKSQRAKPRI